MSSAAFAIVTLVAHALSCSPVPYKVTRRVSGPVASATSFTRRDLALGTAAIATALGYDRPAIAADEALKTVVVAGATGQTGRRCLSRLGAMKGVKAIGGVRDPTKAAQKLAESKIEIRGAMIEKGASIDASSIELKTLDVEKSSVADMSATLKGADSLIIAVGFVPGNPFKMDAAAHAVDNVGTCALIDAAKAAGVRKVVLVSSILTDGGAWGQLNSPGYQITNAFGHVLEEKLVAEKYLRASGLDWTIVRPGGLKADPPTGALFVSGENTLNSGEISRDLVADVSVAALFDPKASNQVVEIVESDKDGNAKTGIFNGLKM
jgi:nucleoside-diphosphate-sugar epimerase